MVCAPVAKSPATVTVETSGARSSDLTLRSALTSYPGTAGAPRPPPLAAPFPPPLLAAGGACATSSELIVIERARTRIFRMRTIVLTLRAGVKARFLLGGLLLVLLFIGARPPEDPRESVISLVAGVLIDRAVAFDHRDHRAPGPGKGFRIVYSEFVKNGVRSRAHEAFGETHILSRSAEPSLVGEIGGLHHQRVGIPAAARIAEPLADTLWQ